MDLTGDGVMRRISWGKDKLRPIDESSDHSRRLDLENAKKLQLFDLEEKSR